MKKRMFCRRLKMRKILFSPSLCFNHGCVLTIHLLSQTYSCLKAQPRIHLPQTPRAPPSLHLGVCIMRHSPTKPPSKIPQLHPCHPLSLCPALLFFMNLPDIIYLLFTVSPLPSQLKHVLLFLNGLEEYLIHIRQSINIC